MSSEFRDDVGAYLLGALEPAEVEAFERALEADPALRSEVESLRVAADALPASPEQMAPPPALKSRIMAIVESEAALLSAAGSQADRVERRERRRLAVLRPGWWSIRPQLALAMTLLVLVLGGGAGVLIAGGAGDTRSFAAELGNAELLIREDGGEHSTLVTRELAEPAAGNVYQVWLQREGEATPEPTNALFSPHSDGTASVDVPGSLDGVEAVIVTEEPEGGSPSPTTDAVIDVRLA